MLKIAEKKKPKKQLVIRVTEEHRKLMQKNADTYANGNLSQWIRYASIMLEPRPEDLTD